MYANDNNEMINKLNIVTVVLIMMIILHISLGLVMS